MPKSNLNIDEARGHGAEPSVETFLLGQVDYEDCLALQERLVYEAGGRRDGQISLLICEHPPGITIGRSGSRAHVHLPPTELTSRQLAVRWVGRGGGCWLHAPGQLAVYPIVPLEPHGFTVGDYLRRLQAGLLTTLAEMNIVGQTRPQMSGVWGRTGQLASIGVAVKNWITYHGAFLNVTPPMRLFRLVEADPAGHTPVSSLMVERQQPVRMTAVRAALVRNLAEAFGCRRYHLYTGHPLLSRFARTRHEPTARAI